MAIRRMQKGGQNTRFSGREQRRSNDEGGLAKTKRSRKRLGLVEMELSGDWRWCVPFSLLACLLLAVLARWLWRGVVQASGARQKKVPGRGRHKQVLKQWEMGATSFGFRGVGGAAVQRSGGPLSAAEDRCSVSRLWALSAGLKSCLGAGLAAGRGCTKTCKSTSRRRPSRNHPRTGKCVTEASSLSTVFVV